MKLPENIQQFPKRPGVYLMRDPRAVVLYVGKANNLRARVGSYFRQHRADRYQIQPLLRRVTDIEYVVTDTEKEALLLEHTLIQRHRPRYNVIFRDDKAFVSIRLTTQHAYPGIFTTRRVVHDGASYFGPYTGALACRETVEQMTRYFKIRICTDLDFANRTRPCMQYQIGRCTAPCVGYVDQATYAKQVNEALWFLQGRRSELVAQLERRMQTAAADEQFEEAARLRDLLRDIATTIEPQKVVRHAAIDRDYVGFATEGDRGAIALLEVREGKVVARVGASVRLGGDEPPALIASFLLQYYQPPRVPPTAISIPLAPSAVAALATVLTERHGGRVRFLQPQRGIEAKLLRLATVNAQAYARTQRMADNAWDALMAQCQTALQLPQPPRVIECLDISHWQGKAAVGSLVCFLEGRPEKSRYRRYLIRTLDTPNDYGMMKEVIERRLHGTIDPPDLLLIDGGKGQLQVALRVLTEMDRAEIPVAAIAKPTDRETMDKIYLPGRKNPVALKAANPVLLLLQRIRDAAHRFGITSTRKRQTHTSLRSILTNVPGIGPKRQQLLLKRFGGLTGLQTASVDSLTAVPGITAAIAEQVLHVVHQ